MLGEVTAAAGLMIVTGCVSAGVVWQHRLVGAGRDRRFVRISALLEKNGRREGDWRRHDRFAGGNAWVTLAMLWIF